LIQSYGGLLTMVKELTLVKQTEYRIYSIVSRGL